VSELGWKKKLIEVALPLDAINSDSAREKLDSPEGDDVVLDVEAGSCLHQMVGELTVVRGQYGDTVGSVAIQQPPCQQEGGD